MKSWKLSIDILYSLVQQMIDVKSTSLLEVVIRDSMMTELFSNEETNIDRVRELNEIVTSLDSSSEINPKYNLSNNSLPMSNKKILPSIV